MSISEEAARRDLLSSDGREILVPPETANSPSGTAAQGDAEGADQMTPSVTPTSTPQRIPPATSCPPAPRKPRPTLSCRRNNDVSVPALIHLTAEEIEAAWQPRCGGELHRRIRRRRSERCTKSRCSP